MDKNQNELVILKYLVVNLTEVLKNKDTDSFEAISSSLIKYSEENESKQIDYTEEIDAELLKHNLSIKLGEILKTEEKVSLKESEDQIIELLSSDKAIYTSLTKLKEDLQTRCICGNCGLKTESKNKYNKEFQIIDLSCEEKHKICSECVQTEEEKVEMCLECGEDVTPKLDLEFRSFYFLDKILAKYEELKDKTTKSDPSKEEKMEEQMKKLKLEARSEHTQTTQATSKEDSSDSKEIEKDEEKAVYIKEQISKCIIKIQKREGELVKEKRKASKDAISKEIDKNIAKLDQFLKEAQKILASSSISNKTREDLNIANDDGFRLLSNKRARTISIIKEEASEESSSKKSISQVQSHGKYKSVNLNRIVSVRTNPFNVAANYTDLENFLFDIDDHTVTINMANADNGEVGVVLALANIEEEIEENRAIFEFICADVDSFRIFNIKDFIFISYRREARFYFSLIGVTFEGFNPLVVMHPINGFILGLTRRYDSFAFSTDGQSLYVNYSGNFFPEIPEVGFITDISMEKKIIRTIDTEARLRITNLTDLRQERIQQGIYLLLDEEDQFTCFFSRNLVVIIDENRVIAYDFEINALLRRNYIADLENINALETLALIDNNPEYALLSNNDSYLIWDHNPQPNEDRLHEFESEDILGFYKRS